MSRRPSIPRLLTLLERHPSVFELQVGDIIVKRVPGGAPPVSSRAPAASPAAPPPSSAAADIDLALNQPADVE